MKQSLVRILLAVFVLAALVAGVGYWKQRGRGASRATIRLERQRPKTTKSGRQKVGVLLSGRIAAPAKAEKKAPVRKKAEQDLMFDQMKPESRKAAEAVQNSLDNDDLEGVRAQVEQALKSDDPEFREHVVDALSWFGAAALPELTAFLADDNPDVADSAANAWQAALSELDDDQLKVSTAQAAMTMLHNPETLTMLMAEVTSQDDDLVSMQVIVDTIHDGTEEAARVARESYEDLTGEKWSSVEAAEAWLQENYEPTESGDDGTHDKKN